MIDIFRNMFVDFSDLGDIHKWRRINIPIFWSPPLLSVMQIITCENLGRVDTIQAEH